jgi:hypothetical protein
VTIRPTRPPSRINFRRLPRLFKQGLVFGGVSGGAYVLVQVVSRMIDNGVAAGITRGLPDALASAAVLVPVGIVTVGVALGTSEGQEVILRPGSMMRRSLQRDAYVAGTLAAGLMAVAAINNGPQSDLPLATMIALGVAIGTSAWPRYLVTVHAYGRRGLLPVRLGRFLDWAHAAGILRLSGTAVQFRHRELQQHLAAALKD